MVQNDGKEKGPRNIGLGVEAPKKQCADRHCPFHGSLPVRGQVIEGIVVSHKMERTVVVKREYLHYLPKYERYEKRSSRYMVHSPPCLELKTGDGVKIAECRPISKHVSFVVVEKR